MAGEMAGRRVLAIELSPIYIDVAVWRWQTFTGKDAVLEQTRQTFAEIESGRAGGALHQAT